MSEISIAGRCRQRRPASHLGILIVGLLLVMSAQAAHAGNVQMQIECGNPPKLAPTDHNVRVSGLATGQTEFRGAGINMPLRGRVGALWLDEHPLTLRDDGVIERGHLDTAELGAIFFYISDERPGYAVVLTPEQLDKLQRKDWPAKELTPATGTGH